MSVPRETLRPKDLKCGIGTVARAKRMFEYLRQFQPVSQSYKLMEEAF